MKKKQRTVLFIEPHLESVAGHPKRYAQAFSKTLVGQGWRCLILAHRDYRGPSHISGARIVRLFPRSYHEVQDRKPPTLRKLGELFEELFSWAGQLRALLERSFRFVEPPPGLDLLRRARPLITAYRLSRRALRLVWRGLGATAAILVGSIALLPYLLFYSVLCVVGRSATRSTLSPFARQVLAAMEREDAACSDLRILIPTATPAILSDLLAVSTVTSTPLPRTALIFHEDPDDYKDWYRPLNLEALQHRLTASGWTQNLGFFATNDRLADIMSNLLGLDVQSVGDVFDSTDVRLLERCAAKEFPVDALKDHERELIDKLRGVQMAGASLAFCPGALRWDKGIKKLETIIRALESGEMRFRLVLQLPQTPKQVRDEVIRLAQHPAVELVRGDLSDEGYAALLGLVDIILLPYDVNSYWARVSRVYLEAALTGKPVLFSSGMSCETDKDFVTSKAIGTWETWTQQARALLTMEGHVASKRGALRRASGYWAAWSQVADWLVTASPRPRPAKPVLYVRPSWLASGSATVFDRHLQFLADKSLPVIEVVVDANCAAAARNSIWRAILEDRAGSAALLTCWSSPRSGLAGMAHALWLLFTRLIGRSYAVQLAETRRLCPLPPIVKQAASKRGFSLLVVNHYFQEPFVASLEGGVPLWIETHDVQSKQMIIRGARNKINGAQEHFDRLLADELEYLKKADVIGAISVDEAEFLRAHLGTAADRVVLCQPFIDLPAPVGAVPACDVLVVASDNPTNIMNIGWFVREVVPLLRKPSPKIRVVGSIGAIAEREGLLSENVEYTGAVKNLAAHYAAARVVALPVVAGAGIAIKALEALAAGKPIVATPLAFRGLPASFEPPTKPVETASSFASALVNLLEDKLAYQLAAAGTRAGHQALGMEQTFRVQMDQILSRTLGLPVE